MKRNTSTLFSLVFVIFIIIHSSLSVIFWELNHKNHESELADYTTSRQASVYRGFLLSLSAGQKHKICKDLFYAQLYKKRHPPNCRSRPTRGIEALITDDERNADAPQYPLTVVEIEPDLEKPENGAEDLMFTCLGINFSHRSMGHVHEIPLSYAYRTSWMYYLYPYEDIGRYKETIQRYVGISPVYVKVKETTLEYYFGRIRRNIKTLQNESPKYIELVEQKDNLSELTEMQKRFLCASILATTTYRNDGLEFSSSWIMDENRLVAYENKLLTLDNEDYDQEGWNTNCIHCKAFADADDDDDYTNLFITRTYDNKHSVLVWKEQNEKMSLTKYFKNVHVLKNVRQKMSFTALYEEFYDDDDD